MTVDDTYYLKAKEEAEKFYKNIGEIYCPYLHHNVSFNAKGLDHIKFKGWNKARLIQDQYTRFKLLKLTPLIVGRSHTLQELCEKKNFERLRSNGKWQHKMVHVVYYAFIAIISDVRLKVIVKKVENLEPYFWSIIPFWKQDNNTINQYTKKVFHDGDLENQ